MKNIISDKTMKLKLQIYEILKEDIAKLSGVKRLLFDTLFPRLLDIFSEDCSENDISQAINGIEKVNSGYVREEDYLTYDGAMRLLGYSRNRNGFSKLMKENNIKQHTFRNTKIGFSKADILALRDKAEKVKRYNTNRNKPKGVRAKDEKPRLSRMEKYY